MDNNEGDVASIVRQLVLTNIYYDIEPIHRQIKSECISMFRAAYPLTEKESVDVRTSIVGREIEYRISRKLARTLLKDHWAITGFDLSKKNNGAPNWPDGLIGSISHSAANCIVVLSETAHYSGIGVDIEEGGNFDMEIGQYVLNPRELDSFPKYMAFQQKLRALFCCKESVFKALERYLRKRIDFKDVFVVLRKSSDAKFWEFTFEISKNIILNYSLSKDEIKGRVYMDQYRSIALTVLSH